MQPKKYFLSESITAYDRADTLLEAEEIVSPRKFPVLVHRRGAAQPRVCRMCSRDGIGRWVARRIGGSVCLVEPTAAPGNPTICPQSTSFFAFNGRLGFLDFYRKLTFLGYLARLCRFILGDLNKMMLRLRYCFLPDTVKPLVRLRQHLSNSQYVRYKDWCETEI